MKLIIDIPNADLEFLQGEEAGTMVLRLLRKELYTHPICYHAVVGGSLGEVCGKPFKHRGPHRRISDARPTEKEVKRAVRTILSKRQTTKAVSTKTVPAPVDPDIAKKIVMDDEGWS